MMHALMLYGLFGIAALLALGAMIGSWRQYGSAWDALEAERASPRRAPVRYLTIRTLSERSCAFVPSEIRKRAPVSQRRHGLRAAA